MNLFGRKKEAPPKADAGTAIIMLRQQLDVLEKREVHLDKKIEVTLTEAKMKAAKKDKAGAMFALKRKKMFEAEVSKLQGAKITLESQVMALESAAVNVDTLKVMKQATDTMKATRQNIDAGTVDDIMDDIQEEKDLADQISEAISRPGQDLFEDDELLSELQELEELNLLESEETAKAPAKAQQAPAAADSVFTFPAVPESSVLPAVPSGPVAVAATEESEDERALRELQASMM